MYHVTRELHFAYGHRLINYAGKCRHLHGHNGRAEITFTTDHLDAHGMVVDFDAIKQRIQTWIDATFDHALLLHRDDPLIPLLREAGQPIYVTPENPTAEAIARTIFEYAASQDLPVTAVRLWETPRSCAVYQPARSRV